MNQMKLKRLFSAVGLGLFAVTSVAAGVLAFSKGPRAEKVEATGEKTWMFRAQLCLGELSPDSEPRPWGEEYVDAVQFHYWGTNITPTTVDAKFLFCSSHDYYTANISLEDDQIIEGAVWKLHQNGHAADNWAYSVDITEFTSNEDAQLDKDSPYVGIEWQVKDGVKDGSAWVDGKWQLMNPLGTETSFLRMQIGVGEYVNHDFAKEPSNNCFAIRDVELAENDAIGFQTDNGFAFSSKVVSLLDAASQKYVDSIETRTNWWYQEEGGTFDLILTDNCLAVRKHEEAVATYIYYVTEADAYCGDYIYAWGGSSQFGAFPGVAVSTGIDVSYGGKMQFQGLGVGKRIYKIPVSIGYPTGDAMFLFNNGTADYKSADRALVSGAAYWWTGGVNVDAGLALDFIGRVETIRRAVEASVKYKAESVCGISETDAKTLVAAYNALSEEVRTTYVDDSKIQTYDPQDSGYLALVTYRDIMERVSIIAGVALVSSTVINSRTVNTNVLLIGVVVISTLTIASLAVFLVIRKRKHQ